MPDFLWSQSPEETADVILSEQRARTEFLPKDVYDSINDLMLGHLHKSLDIPISVTKAHPLMFR